MSYRMTILVKDEKTRAKICTQAHGVTRDDPRKALSNGLAHAENLSLRGVGEAVVVSYGPDSLVLIDVVRSQRQRKVSSELDVVDPNLEVENSRRHARGPADGVAGEVGEAGGGQVVLGDEDVRALVDHVEARGALGQPCAGIKEDGIVGVAEGAEGAEAMDDRIPLHVCAEADGVAVAEEGDRSLVDVEEEAEGVVGHEGLSRALNPHPPHPDLPRGRVAP
mmetsp:Transcript_12006/g.41632  ORF Transcript_12006/g.41632 Transcript_12006/m.41632 type:complete len:222 (-) Transcript_12006:1169-1834(-)